MNEKKIRHLKTKCIYLMRNMLEIEDAVEDCKIMVMKLNNYDAISDGDVDNIKFSIRQSIEPEFRLALNPKLRKWLNVTNVNNFYIDLNLFSYNIILMDFLNKYKRTETKVGRIINKIVKMYNEDEPVQYIKRSLQKQLTNEEISFLMERIFTIGNKTLK